jgi:hypothetical protein
MYPCLFLTNIVLLDTFHSTDISSLERCASLLILAPVILPSSYCFVEKADEKGHIAEVNLLLIELTEDRLALNFRRNMEILKHGR